MKIPLPDRRQDQTRRERREIAPALFALTTNHFVSNAGVEALFLFRLLFFIPFELGAFEPYFLLFLFLLFPFFSAGGSRAVMSYLRV